MMDITGEMIKLYRENHHCDSDMCQGAVLVGCSECMITAIIKAEIEQCVVCRTPAPRTTYMEPLKSQMVEHQMCFGCNFWREKTKPEVRDALNTIRADGVHYTIEDEYSQDSFRGYSGSKWIIRLSTGEVVVTTNLWHQGKIPGVFKDQLPNNASFFHQQSDAPKKYLVWNDKEFVETKKDVRIPPTIIKCPNCKKKYSPALRPNKAWTTGVSVQDAYPDAKPWQREQLISGICSDKCWMSTWDRRSKDDE